MHGGGLAAWIRGGMAAPDKGKSRAAAFRARLISTLGLWGVVTAVFLIGEPWAFAVLVALLGAWGSVEFVRLTRSVPGGECRWWSLIVSLGFLGILTWRVIDGSLEPTGCLPEVIGLTLVVLGAFGLRLRHEINGPESIYPVALATLGFVYVPVLFSAFAIRLYLLPEGTGTERSGLLLILMVVLSAKFTDMGAYLVGTLIGRHKAIPHVSPAKSWEGYIGSLFFAQAGALGVYFLGGDHFAWIGSVVHIVVLAVLISVAAMAGDLAESILKRSLGVKDSGKLLPGIGGVLDLVDSLCFAIPVAFIYLVTFVF